MELEKKLTEYKRQTMIDPREGKIAETIQKSQDAFVRQEQEQPVSYFEFLLGQFHMLRKRWWGLQTILLGLAFANLQYTQSRAFTLKTLGVTGVLFVVLLIPEFWKNKVHDCMQVEGACLYSLRQIYAARMLLFGMADLLILTCFCITAGGKLGLAAADLLIQFLFPMLVAACICFGTFCSRMLISEGMAIILCLMWSVVWYFVVLNEAVYAAITLPVWCVLFGLTMFFFAGAVYKTIHDCNQFWEVDLSGITIHSFNETFWGFQSR